MKQQELKVSFYLKKNEIKEDGSVLHPKSWTLLGCFL